MIAAVCFGSAWLGSCSLLVDPGSLVIKCQVTPGLSDADPCIEAGMHCVAGTCQACEGAREDCNGIDDDCDGYIDEGHDQDGDHYTWCGGGIPELADCVPTDPTIHPSSTQPGPDGVLGPAAVELCDGKDNDCDGKVDESPECQMSQTCVEIGCQIPGQYCDASSGHCIAPRAVGSGCATDTECEAGFCMNPSEFQLSGDATAKRCASACCTDADCARGTVCEVADSGMRACLPMELVARGDGKDGGECHSGGDCVSGICLRSTCRARCKADTDCSGSAATCSLATLRSGGTQSWVCGAGSGHGGAREFCTVFDPTACKSGLCDDKASLCSAPCGRDADCLAGESCNYFQYASLVPPSTSLLARCEMKTATDKACCTNADCASPALCKPKMIGMRVGMVCQSP
jgi:hypothetical protein